MIVMSLIILNMDDKKEGGAAAKVAPKKQVHCKRCHNHKPFPKW